MAVYNEIGIGRWNRFIQKLTDIKGSPPARQLASEIVFQHPIFHGAENRYLEGWDRFALVFNIAAQAANVDGFQLRNPSGSNVIAVFEKVQVANTSAAATGAIFVSSGLAAADLVTVAGSQNWRLDPRGRSAPTLILSTQNSTPAIPVLIAQEGNPTLAANTTYDVIQDAIQEIPVLPGDALRIVGSTVNITMGIAVMWRERLLEPAERF